MPDGNRRARANIWAGVGVHPTPSDIVKAFARAVVGRTVARQDRSRSFSILDACAGDGRLGHAVAKRLSRLGYSVELTLVEADPTRISMRRTSYIVKYVQADFYSYLPAQPFDVVVSNPPYLALGRSQAAILDLDWRKVREWGRNLYGLALEKCVSLCMPGGIVALLAPHGWLQNSQGMQLRRLVDRSVQSLDVYASRSRRLFPGVQQDVAVQLFHLREVPSDNLTARVRISYDDTEFAEMVAPLSLPDAHHLILRVRVGLFVWNRERERLSKRATSIPVIYGGNISADGSLRFDVHRYRERQFVARSRIPDTYLSRGPCLLIKRTMRGAPGAWKLDVAVVVTTGQFVAENHVIVVELVRHMPAEAVMELGSAVAGRIELNHRHHGHPNVSVSLVRQALGLK